MMTDLQTDVKRRLLYMLHLGFVETRSLALAQRHQQLFDLADAMELLPGAIDAPTAEQLELIRSSLRGYKGKHPEAAFEYLKYLDWEDIPERF